MRVVVFAGPTLERGAVERRDGFVAAPPAGQGDVLAAARGGPWAIALVDGYFERVPAVWHKEILWAMAEGVHVFGAASMGALRAAELEAFGMVGVGRIFAAYRDGELEDDDEVAVLHGTVESGYRVLTEPLVEVRATLAAARSAGILDPAAEARLLALAKGLHYRERSRARWLAAAREEAEPIPGLDALERWLPGGWVAQKRADATALLDEIERRRAADPSPKRVRYRLHHTALWHDLCQQVAGRPSAAWPGADTYLPEAPLEELALLGREESAGVRERALSRLYAVELARQRGMRPSGHEVAETADRHPGVGDERSLREQALVARLRRLAEPRLAPHLRAQLELEGRWDDLSSRARDKQRRLGAEGLESPTLLDLGMSREELWSWYFGNVLGRDEPADLAEWARAAGFRDRDELERALLREAAYRRLAPARVAEGGSR